MEWWQKFRVQNVESEAAEKHFPENKMEQVIVRLD
jgi:hypothetical protein